MREYKAKGTHQVTSHETPQVTVATEEGTRSAPSQHQVEAQEAHDEAQVDLQKCEVAMLRLYARQDAKGAQLLEAAGYSKPNGKLQAWTGKALELRTPALGVVDTLFPLTFLLQTAKLPITAILTKRSMIYEGICNRCQK